MIENCEVKFNKLVAINNQQLRKILLFVKDEPLFLDDEKRLLSKEEIVNYEKELETKIVDIIPLIDCYDNQYLIYIISENVFAFLDISEDLIYNKNTDVTSYIELIEDINIIEVNRSNYLELEWNERARYRYRGITFYCDHETDSGVYDVWLNLPNGPNYKFGGVGEVPYCHQYFAGYMFGETDGPDFAGAIEALMKYVDEYYEYLEPYIKKKSKN